MRIMKFQQEIFMRNLMKKRMKLTSGLIRRLGETFNANVKEKIYDDDDDHHGGDGSDDDHGPHDNDDVHDDYENDDKKLFSIYKISFTAFADFTNLKFVEF